MTLIDIQKAIRKQSKMLFLRELNKRLLGKTITVDSMELDKWANDPNKQHRRFKKHGKYDENTIVNIQNIEANPEESAIYYTDENGARFKSYLGEKIVIHKS
jgi:hypothetical protein